MARPAFRRQLDILVDRNVAIHWGSFGTVSLMLLQAPIIGGFIGLAWKGQEPAAQTHFVMAVAALWMGCMNATTSVVQERAVYMRERMFELDLGAYLLSKLAVLAVIGAVQAILLLAAQGRLMHLKESFGAQALTFLIMAATDVAAAGLGLLISTMAKTSYGAVVAVPILLIPQVLFSKVILQGNIDKGVPAALEKLTLTKWCYDALSDLQGGATWSTQLGSLAALAVGLSAFLTLAYLKLWSEDT